MATYSIYTRDRRLKSSGLQGKHRPETRSLVYFIRRERLFANEWASVDCMALKKKEMGFYEKNRSRGYLYTSV